MPLRSITVFLVFASWRDLLATLTFEQPRQGRRSQNAEMRTAASLRDGLAGFEANSAPTRAYVKKDPF